jgi:hypothetical protein
MFVDLPVNKNIIFHRRGCLLKNFLCPVTFTQSAFIHHYLILFTLTGGTKPQILGMNKSSIFALLAMMLIVIIGSCKHEIPFFPPDSSTASGDSSTPCDPNKVYFQQQVLPILVSYCAKSGCHDNASHKEGIILTSYNSTMQTGGIKPGNPNDSKIYKEIVKGEMPPAGNSPLTTAQKNLIYNWIIQGAENLVCQNICGDTVNINYSLSVNPIIINKCQGCHSGANPQGGIDLSSYLAVKAQISNGKLWGAVNWSPGFSPMPKNGNKLSECELTKIQKWIAQGAPNN